MRRPQFSLRTLLVAMAILGAGLAYGNRWRTLRHQASAARERFEEAMCRFDFGEARFSEVRAASTAALHAEQGVPLQRERSAWLAHLERTKTLEAEAWGILGLAELGLAESLDEWGKTYDELRTDRQSIEQRLGLPADPTLTKYHRLLMAVKSKKN